MIGGIRMRTVNKLVIGSVRAIDSRGRIHIPPEILSFWGKEVREVNIFVENGKLVVVPMKGEDNG